MKLEKATRISTAIDWATQLLSADFSAIKEELLSEYLICSFEYFFRASDSETQATFKNLIQEKEQKSFKAWTSNAIRASFSEYGMEKSCFALLLAHLIHDYTPAWDRFEDWGNKTKIDFAAMLQSKLSQNLETLNQKQEKRKLGWTKEQELQEKKVHALYFDLPLFLGICWEKEDELLELLHDEAFGKRVCRLIGVKLPKDLEYVPAQILEKLKGRKAELETIFPKYKLPKKEADLLKVFQAIPDRALPDLIPEAIQFRTGPIYDFLKKCIQKASSESNIALAEFLTASVRKEKLSLPLLHRDTVQIINKIIKKEALTGYVELDKKAKAVCFIQQNLAIQKE